MSHNLIIQANYTEYQVGLYSDTQQVALAKGDKRYSSKEFIPAIDSMLKQHDLSSNTLGCIGVNQGPGPFTSLRVAVTTANGIAFGSNIPLIGINSLHALLRETTDPNWPLTVALLNAYSRDLYYAIQHNGTMQQGCKNNEILLTELKEQFPDTSLRFIGNGATMNQDLIKDIFGESAFIPEDCPQEPSLDTFALMTYEQLKLGNTFNMLKPIYLKQLTYKPLF